MKQLSLLLLVIASALPPALEGEPADVTEYSSGGHRVSLVELYTSEGCSSCPPADRWLSSLVDDERLWRDFVPVAFHVDYWDYIGWPDRFADPANSDRQRRYAYESEKPVIYTPGMFVDGREWLEWRREDSPPEAASPSGELVLRLTKSEVQLRFASQTPLAEPLIVHFGLRGMNLETDVKAGENRGRRLTHDFVLLHLDSTALNVAEDRHSATATLPVIKTQPTAGAFVAWVATDRAQAPIQVVGGYLPLE